MTATNVSGTVSQTFQLKMESLPKIKFPDRYKEAQIFDKGETIKIKMNFTGRPVPQADWSKDGQSIEGVDRYLIEHTESSSSFEIDRAEKLDRGKYTLRCVQEIRKRRGFFSLILPLFAQFRCSKVDPQLIDLEPSSWKLQEELTLLIIPGLRVYLRSISVYG